MEPNLPNNDIPSEPEEVKPLENILEQPEKKELKPNELLMHSDETKLQNDKEKMKDALAKPLVPGNDVKKEKKFLKIFPSGGKLGLFYKIAVAIVVGLVALGVFVLIVFFTNLDTKILKIKLEGTVINANNLPVANAKIYENNEVIAETDAEGKFAIKGLNPGKMPITIKADGYIDLSQDVPIARSLFNYVVKQSFTLKFSGQSSLAGKFITDDEKYTFVNDTISLGDKDYKINSDGTFQIDEVAIGETTFKYKSLSFKDVSQKIILKSGLNKISDITLNPAGDIDGDLISYIREDKISSVDIQVENVTKDQITIDSSNAKFKVADLQIGKEYSLRFVTEGYQTRDYKVTVKQGENTIFDLKFVESGVAIFGMKSDGINDPQVKSSELDGTNLTALTSEDNLDFNSEYYAKSENKFYLMTNVDNVQSNGGFSGKFTVPYSLDLSTNTLKLMLTDKTLLGKVIPNFIAKKAVNLKKDSGAKTETIQFMDIDGTDRTTLVVLTNSTVVDYLKLSDNGKSIFYIQHDKDDNFSMQYVNTETKQVKVIAQKENMEIYDVSPDGNRVIYTANNTSTTFKDLLMYDITTSENRTLIVNATGEDYQFIEGSNNAILYMDSKTDKNNIYTYEIDKNSSKQITTIAATETMETIYQSGDFVFYITNSGLYVIDINKPHLNKVVVTGEVYHYGEISLL